jgi:TonB family protein
LFGRDLILSVVFHGVLLTVTLVAGSMDYQPPSPLVDVIQVGVVSMSEISPATPAAPEPEPVTEVEVPPAVQAEPEEIVLEDPTTKPAEVIEEPVEKPKPKPKPPEEPKPKPPTQPAQTGETNQAGTGEDQVEVEGPRGTSISGMTIGNANFDYPHWPSLAFSKINRFFYFSMSIDGKVYCDVKFEVIKSGKVIGSEIVKSSGIPSFDQACLTAIERSSPLPPLPRQWRDEYLIITVSFTNL